MTEWQRYGKTLLKKATSFKIVIFRTASHQLSYELSKMKLFAAIKVCKFGRREVYVG